MNSKRSVNLPWERELWYYFQIDDDGYGDEADEDDDDDPTNKPHLKSNQFKMYLFVKLSSSGNGW